MHPVPFLRSVCIVLMLAYIVPGYAQFTHNSFTTVIQQSSAATSICNCTITQDGLTYPINALMGTESATLFYDYGNPNGSSANTGLEMSNGLILFLYEDLNTGIISLFLIADIANDGSGGSLTFEVNCLPADSYIAVQDDGGEFNGAPPLVTGNWSWGDCCTDGGVIESIGCNNALSLDLLVSSGIDSIVWLTGDIADPTNILMSLTGEAITINCGGGVCCPIGFDTEIMVTDASCPETADGVIVVNPQDGLPPFSYDWSNGATTATNSDLLPGTYGVTVTDAQGCSEEHVITVDFAPGEPPAQGADIELCSVDNMDFFDLTSVDDIVNLGSGYEVLWFENSDLTGSISDPSNYFSGSGTVYAAVDNGFCLSDPVAVNLILLAQPLSYTATLYACEEDDGMATFDLTSLDDIVSNDIGTVSWYLDANLSDPVSEPEVFFTETTTVYATVEDGPCISEPVEVYLIVDPKPLGDEEEMHLCGDVNNEAIFDLTVLEYSISGGNGVVYWYLEYELLDPISSPSNFQSPSTIVYAVVFDGVCYSDAIPVDLVVEMTPVGNPLTIQTCGNQSGTATINLWDYTSQVGGPSGSVNWFLDQDLTEPISNPQAFVTETTTIFATVDNGVCTSGAVPIEISVTDQLNGMNASLETCADTSGQGLFNLSSLDATVSGGIGTVTWYEDALGNTTIANPGTYMSGSATVYAQITDSVCSSGFIPVMLNIVNSVTANPVQISLCDEGSGIATFDLLSLENSISGGVGQVNWFMDPSGISPFTATQTFTSGNTTLYARVNAGNCISEIVPVQLNVLQVPLATGTSLTLCGDEMGQATIDLTTLDGSISSNTGMVSWYNDATLNNPIANPNSFFTSDTILYAIVSNANCSANPVDVIINVSSQLTANPATLELCKEQGDTLQIDLTQLDFNIGGSYTVNWFSDAGGINVIPNPDAHSVIVTETIYANITDGICTSAFVPIQLVIAEIPVANSVSINKCGDINGQVTIDLISYNTLISDNSGIVNWYSDNLLVNEISNTGSFTTGDTTLYIQVTNSFCYSPVVPVTVDIVDSLTANPTTFVICIQPNGNTILDLTSSDVPISGGNGNVSWFTDPQGNNPISDPQNFLTADNTVYAQVDAEGCVSAIIAIPITAFIQPAPPELFCDTATLDAISFNWTSNGQQFGYQYSVNNTSIQGPFFTTDSELTILALSAGDEVLLSMWTVGTLPCRNSDTVSLSCFTELCPDVTLSIDKPQFVCTADDPVQLNVNVDPILMNPVITWSGEGIIDPSGLFDIDSQGNYSVEATIESMGCLYSVPEIIIVLPSPIASFVIDGVPCLDSILSLRFNGNAYFSSDWHWDFAGATVNEIDRPVDFYMKWDEPGDYVVSLWIDYFGCLSELFSLPVTIDAPLEPPVIQCQIEDYYSLQISWDPVIGATEYIATSNLGTGKLSGKNFTVSNLPDDTPVTITVTALGSTSCGPVSSSVECRTLKYIPTNIFIPDIFSPNGDGLNDKFYVQSNSQIKEVTSMRIFDRWGNVLFEKRNLLANSENEGWDGTFSGKELNPGVYLYRIELLDIRDEMVIMSGDVTLIR